MSDLTRMPTQRFHFGSIGGIVESYVAFGVANYHSLLQKIELKGRNLIRSYIHVDPLDITV